MLGVMTLCRTLALTSSYLCSQHKALKIGELSEVPRLDSLCTGELSIGPGLDSMFAILL